MNTGSPVKKKNKQWKSKKGLENLTKSPFQKIPNSEKTKYNMIKTDKKKN